MAQPKLKISTSFINPPIPDRRFDWQAFLEGEEEGITAYGATEAEAIADLELQIEENSCLCRYETVDSASIYPPEPIANPSCPIHGRDPDNEREDRADA